MLSEDEEDSKDDSDEDEQDETPDEEDEDSLGSDEVVASDEEIDPLTYVPPARRYPGRDRRQTDWLHSETAHTAKKNQNTAEPETLFEALESPDAEKWKLAIDNAVESLFENSTWTVVTVSKDRKVLGSRFVLTKKLNTDGSLDRHKARLVVKGYQQKDAKHVYAPVMISPPCV